MFHFERHVVWADAKQANSGATTYSNAYKRTVVIVSWSDQGGTNHSVRQDAYIYPGGVGTYVASSCHPSGGPVATAPPKPVTGLTASKDVTNPTSTINLGWTAPVGGFICDSLAVLYSSDSFATTQVAAISTPSSTTFAVTGLADGTPFTFQVYSVQQSTGAEIASNQASAATDAAPPPAGFCAVQSSALGLTGGSANVGADQATSGATLVVPGTATPTNINLSVVTTGVCAFLQMSYTTIAGDPSITRITMAQPTTNHWTATLNGFSTNWSIGAHHCRSRTRSAPSWRRRTSQSA